MYLTSKAKTKIVIKVLICYDTTKEFASYAGVYIFLVWVKSLIIKIYEEIELYFSSSSTLILLLFFIKCKKKIVL